MKLTKSHYRTGLFLIASGILGGCVAVPPAPEQETPEAPPLLEPTIIVAEREPEVPDEEEDKQSGSCGSLPEFVLDIQKLESKERKQLLDQLSGFEGGKFSCDRLKTGLLLSQIGKTASEDSLAIEILTDYKDADKLADENKQLVQLLLFQSKERKRLHILLYKLGDKLVTEKALARTLSTDLLTLQQKLNQLQKLETDINETEQSIATPSTSTLDTSTEENTGS